jgi:phosphoglycolate phosphatase-like HAD superfamily hydrolase
MRQRLGAIRAAIVDLDGTMVDTLGDFEAALGAVLRELRLPAVSRAFIEATVGKGSEHLIRTTLAHAGGSPALYDDAWAHYQRHYQAINGQHAPVYPGAAEGLLRLRAAGLRLACLTNWPSPASSWPRRGCRGTSNTASAAIRSHARSPTRCPCSGRAKRSAAHRPAP